MKAVPVDSEHERDLAPLYLAHHRYCVVRVHFDPKQYYFLSKWARGDSLRVHQRSFVVH